MYATNASFNLLNLVMLSQGLSKRVLGSRGRSVNCHGHIFFKQWKFAQENPFINDVDQPSNKLTFESRTWTVGVGSELIALPTIYTSHNFPKPTNQQQCCIKLKGITRNLIPRRRLGWANVVGIFTT